MTESGDTVVVELARDLAGGLRGRQVRITASGEMAQEAAAYWRQMLSSSGLAVLGLVEDELEGSARIHLHDEARSATSYSATGLALEELSRDLVGEVIGLGESAADRYSSLIAVADAVVNELAERT